MQETIRQQMKQLFPFILGVSLALTPSVGAASEHPAFAVQVTGKGRPVILIPGLSSSGAVWEGTVAHLKEHYECHVLTLAGFAGQKPISAPFLEAVRDQLAVYIRERKLDHPIVIGHSLGGFMALWLDSNRPELTGPLIIVDSLPYLPAVYNPAATVDTMKPMAEQMRDGMAKGGSAFIAQSEAALKSMVTSPENVELAMTWAKTTDPASAGNAVYDMFTTDLRNDVGNITVPTLVLGTWIAYADKPGDTAMRSSVEKNFQTQYTRLKGVKIVLADHARHFIMLDDPAWFYSQVDSFLSEAH